MNKKTIWIIVIAIAAVLVIFTVSSYNSLVSSQINVENSAANIDAQLQRRADLVPNLIETVKGYTNHETEVFTAVTQARENLLSADTMEEKAAANDEITSALGRLLAIAEAYPDLKSNTVYTGLMDELSGTENRIAVARTDYNNVVTEYNRTIRRFPKSIFAGIFGFEKAEFFAADEGARTAPEVNFD